MSIIITLLLVASVAVNVWLLRRRARPGKQSVRSTLLQGIKNVKDLATIRQNFQSIVIFEDTKALLGFSLPGTGRKFILKYSGTITCGNDLSKIRISERFAVNRVRVVVPRSRLLDLYADMKSIQVYDQKAGFFTSIELQDQNREISNNLEEVRQDALQSDILRRADENTRTVLVSLVASLGMEAEVIFDDREADVIRAPSQEYLESTEEFFKRENDVEIALPEKV
ncbi:MAG: DUF4230 domain-containing protein [Synergistaceae bacterium]|nr:DUF4230 domain-containing protein [Synergistaceae bacterium]